ncbi:hypothetical protein HRG_001196 [Hirsutella rhossiliensis]|uniref:Uncharacterized protein n=1 Tax=Hirsutella rhossiliensis TaxID=111463 RepID=A0A9P8SNM4_9HYPO|nr:uncharacterized protein HRG_01196 [Hirsutella rhossiliensis]KAH0968554.1 hypothetical protein HRG_01196 [Hirsutella rhossiliensis]
MSMPVHRRASLDQPPVLIHRIEKTPEPPSPQVTITPKRMFLRVAKENTIPDAGQWALWLKTNLPSYVGDIALTAKWKTGSALVAVVLPIEIWLGLPEREAYSFMDHHHEWDTAATRQRHAAVLAPPAQQQLQEQGPPGMRSANV